jgi:hypothetical protein
MRAWYQFDTTPGCRYALPPALNVERPLISIRVVGDEVVAADTQEGCWTVSPR